MIRELVDPNHTLPEVRLNFAKPTEAGFSGGSISHFIIMSEPDGLDVGSGYLQIDNRQREVSFANIARDKRYEVKGIGLAAYVEAIELAHSMDYSFISCNTTLNAYSARVWERLINLGCAQVVEPLAASIIWADKFTGRFVIPPEAH